jgi:hypothetical protein
MDAPTLWVFCVRNKFISDAGVLPNPAPGRLHDDWVDDSMEIITGEMAGRNQPAFPK